MNVLWVAGNTIIDDCWYEVFAQEGHASRQSLPIAWSWDSKLVRTSRQSISKSIPPKTDRFIKSGADSDLCLFLFLFLFVQYCCIPYKQRVPTYVLGYYCPCRRREAGLDIQKRDVLCPPAEAGASVQPWIFVSLHHFTPFVFLCSSCTPAEEGQSLNRIEQRSLWLTGLPDPDTMHTTLPELPARLPTCRVIGESQHA